MTGAIQGVPEATRHGTRCKRPFPGCGPGSRCMEMQQYDGQKWIPPICVDDDKCIPVRAGIGMGGWNEDKYRCCNGYRERMSSYTGNVWAACYMPLLKMLS